MLRNGRDLLPTSLAAELNGFMTETGGCGVAGAVAGIRATGQQSYHLYLYRYGVKWLTGYELHCFEDGDGIHLSVDFDSPWGPPTEGVMCVISARFNARFLHTYAEVGCGFCGYGEYANSLLTDCESHDIGESLEENEHGFYDVTGSAYILDFL